MALRRLLSIFVIGSGLVWAAALGGCPADPSGGGGSGTAQTRHEVIFTRIIGGGFQGTRNCIFCHSNIGRDLLKTGHWNWSGVSANIAGHEEESHGKRDLLNNFYIGVPSNEGRCTQCHPSYGWKSNTPAAFFESMDNIDCLICHDTTGTYRKHATAAGGGGRAALVVDGQVTVATPAELQNVVFNLGKPRRANCGQCHFFAGGGDNVKHGDLSSDLNAPTREMDVHMGGLDFSCQTCHTMRNHGIAGMGLHSLDEGAAAANCVRCHGEQPHQGNRMLAPLLNSHTAKVACQTCHIPTFARSKPTRLEWYWGDAGRDIGPIPTDEFGRPTHDKGTGSFVWGKNVRPTYRWFDGKWTRMIIGVSDTFAAAGTKADPVIIAEPTARFGDAGAKVYPFKKMIGNQPADSVNKRLIVPHLFGRGENLENPYWETYDWGAALAEGAAYAGQSYSGEYEFVNTVMYLSVNHEIAPKEQALLCDGCHGVPGFFEALGYDEDPFGSR